MQSYIETTCTRYISLTSYHPNLLEANIHICNLEACLCPLDGTMPDASAHHKAPSNVRCPVNAPFLGFSNPAQSVILPICRIPPF